MKVCDRCLSNKEVFTVAIADTSTKEPGFSAELCGNCCRELAKIFKEFVQRGITLADRMKEFERVRLESIGYEKGKREMKEKMKEK